MLAAVDCPTGFVLDWPTPAPSLLLPGLSFLSSSILNVSPFLLSLSESVFSSSLDLALVDSLFFYLMTLKELSFGLKAPRLDC